MKENNYTGLEVAIIGMSCRFPGANTPEEFWENLLQGKESISFLSEDKLNIIDIITEEGQNLFVPSQGAILENVYDFDASFFGYSDVEAELMSPHIRMFHECAWEALENAGHINHLDKKNVAMFAGVSNTYLWEMVAGNSSLSSMVNDITLSQLINRDFLCTLISYKFGLNGPSCMIQSACSSSLASVHFACQSLLAGDCEMALAGGVSLRSSNKRGYFYEDGFILSKDGRCFPFDIKSSGTVEGEGIGIIVMKRLEDALHDKDNIISIIKGSAINNDGNRKVGYAAPSIEGQIDVIEKAMTVSEVRAGDISFVEAHGSGTKLGDLTEFQALKLAFKTSKLQFCALGSVKHNIGHLDISAGIAGLIKAALITKYKIIPPNSYFNQANENISLESSPFFINKEMVRLKNQDDIFVSASSLGIGGTNVHTILQGIEQPATVEHNNQKILLLSAKTEDALKDLSFSMLSFLMKNKGVNMSDLEYTLRIGRKSFPYRKSIICESEADAISILKDNNSRKSKSNCVRDENPKIVFIFSGLGIDFHNYGKNLYKEILFFKKKIDECFEEIRDVAGSNIAKKLHLDNNELDIKRLSFHELQFLLFAVEYGLASLLINYDIKPSAVIGYSFGEITAAYFSGALDLKSVIRLLHARGIAVNNCKNGLMISVPLNKEQLLPYLKNSQTIAINNGDSCVVSGFEDDIEQLEQQLKNERILSYRLNSDYPLHSKIMNDVSDLLLQNIHGISARNILIPWISNITGTWVSGKEEFGAEYWANHITNTVEFSKGIETLIELGDIVFVEIGPNRNILNMLSKYKDSVKAYLNFLPIESNDANELSYFNLKLSETWLSGININWDYYYENSKRKLLNAPSYPFQHRRFDKVVKEFGNARNNVNTLNSYPNVSDNLYLPGWKRVKPIKSHFEKLKAFWLIFKVDNYLYNNFRKRLASEDIVDVSIGKEFKIVSEQEVIIDPSDLNSYKELFNLIGKKSLRSLKIVHFWSLNCSVFNSFDAIQELGYNSLINISKFINGERFTDIEKDIHVVTTDILNVLTNENLEINNSTILGPVNVISQELTNTNCNITDFSKIELSKKSINYSEMLYSEITGKRNSRIVAIRNGQCWVNSFESANNIQQGVKSLITEDSVYWIIGGLGNIGYTLSKYLMKTFNAKLIITGTTDLSNNETKSIKTDLYIKRLKKLKSMGNKVVYIQGDLGVADQVSELYIKCESVYQKINGVFYLAGITSGRSFTKIEDVNIEYVKDQLQAKVYGAINLKQLLEKKPTEFCVMVSSISAYLGGIGLCTYSGVNNFINQLVHSSNKDKKTDWIAVNWDGSDAHSVYSGFDFILRHPEYEEWIFSQNKDFIKRYEEWITNPEKVKFKPAIKKENHNDKPRPFLYNEYVEPRDSIEKTIVNIWENLLGFNELGIEDSFLELGGDSLKAINMLLNLNRKYNVSIPLKSFFITPNVKGLANCIKGADREEFKSIVKCEKREHYPVSSPQKRLYFLHMLAPESVAYNVPQLYKISGEVDKIKINSVFQKLIDRHEALRTHFAFINGEIRQIVENHWQINIQYENTIDEPNQIVNSFLKPYDLNKQPLMRIGFFETESNSSYLLIDLHHIISDDVTQEVLIREFFQLYNGEEPDPVHIQYIDYAASQYFMRNTTRNKSVMQYWLKMFKGKLPKLEFDVQHDAASGTDEGDEIYYKLNEGLNEELKKLMVKTDTTHYMLLLAIFNILLSKYTGYEDVIIGTPTSGRYHSDLANVVGMFIGQIAMRNYPKFDKTFLGFVSEVKTNSILAYDNQDYNFEELISELGLDRETINNPLFNCVFAIMVKDKNNNGSNDNSRTKVEPVRFKNSNIKSDIRLGAIITKEGTELHFSYNNNKVSDKMAQEMVTNYISILEQVIESPLIKLGDISMKNTNRQPKEILERYKKDFRF